MTTLHLLRHLKSSWDEPGLADFDRPLAPRGLKAGRAVARHVGRQGIIPDLILCSAARRTRETLQAVGESWRGIDTCIERALYEAPESALLERLRCIPPTVGTVLLIGHNPGMERLAALLCDGRGDPAALARMAAKFPTGALASIACDAPWPALERGRGRLLSYIRPVDLP